MQPHLNHFNNKSFIYFLLLNVHNFYFIIVVLKQLSNTRRDCKRL